MDKYSKEDLDLALAYLKYRPRYDADVYETIMDYCKEGGSGTSVAVDVGCASGQSTVALSLYFDKVIGVDINPAHIDRAPIDNPKIEFRVSAAEDMSYIDSHSVDLVTIATALHWMDHTLFYKEVERILKPRGTIAVYGYATGFFPGCPEANDIFLKVRFVSLQMSSNAYLSCKKRLGRWKLNFS